MTHDALCEVWTEARLSTLINTRPSSDDCVVPSPCKSQGGSPSSPEPVVIGGRRTDGRVKALCLWARAQRSSSLGIRVSSFLLTSTMASRPLAGLFSCPTAERGREDGFARRRTGRDEKAEGRREGWGRWTGPFKKQEGLQQPLRFVEPCSRKGASLLFVV